MAKGKVRCGACLAIFQATDYMLEPSKKLQKSVPNSATKDQKQDQNQMVPRQQVQSANMDVQHDLYIDEPESKPSIVNDASTTDISAELSKDMPSTEQQIQKQQPQDVLQSPIQESSGNTTKGAHKDESNMDSEVNFDQSERDHSGMDSIGLDSRDVHASETDDIAFEDPELDESLLSDEYTSQQPGGEIESVGHGQVEDPFIDEEVVSEEIDRQEISDNAASEIAIDETDFEKSDINDETDFLDGAEYSENSQDVGVDVDDQDLAHELGATDELSHQLSEQMLETDSDPDPLDEFNNIVEENGNSMKIKLAVASMLVLLIIAFTSIWTNRQAIAWSESWGDTMNSVCQYLPCDLKPRRDVSKIKLLQRQLSPDEELENVLDIKVLLINEATFAQPYPTIKIAFSNKNGEQVSVKSFSPTNYLDSQTLGDLMPSQSEVHIHFKTEVTHPDALGFEFIFE